MLDFGPEDNPVFKNPGHAFQLIYPLQQMLRVCRWIRAFDPGLEVLQSALELSFLVPCNALAIHFDLMFDLLPLVLFGAFFGYCAGYNLLAAFGKFFRVVEVVVSPHTLPSSFA